MDNDRMVERVSFETEVEKLLKGKPKRYGQILQYHIDRHLQYSKGKSIPLDIIIMYMVQLDKEYVTVREDLE